MRNYLIKNLLLNHLMKNGSKNLSEKLLIKIVKLIQKNLYYKNFEGLIKLSLINSSPHIFLKKLKRRKKVSLEVPFLLKNSIRISYGIKFILKEFLSHKNSLLLTNKIYRAFLESSSFKGFCIKNIDELHKKAFINKKFSNYRWF